jgi:hypothetical protein
MQACRQAVRAAAGRADVLKSRPGGRVGAAELIIKGRRERNHTRRRHREGHNRAICPLSSM